MITPENTYLLLRALVDELARCGMKAACTSPGSRCAPLVLSLAREERLHCYSHVDERCSGFFALGLAKVSGLPVAVTCTSGTAAAELLPAAIEAREARVPLLLLTADRPSELRDNGAGQAIDQLKLYGTAVKWFVEVDTHDATTTRLRWIRTLACRAYWTALEGSPGAVHLNFPLREPLVTEDPLPNEDTGRPDGSPYLLRTPTLATESDEPAAGGLAAVLKGARRGVVVTGRHERHTPVGEATCSFCEAAGWPLLADPMSGARRGSAAIAHYDVLLRDERFARSNRPEIVVRVGDLPVSKPLRTWLASLDGVPQVAVDPEGAYQDPDSVVSRSLALEPAQALHEATALWTQGRETGGDTDGDTNEEAGGDARGNAGGDGGGDGGGDPDWLSSWRTADELAGEAILGALTSYGPAGDGLSEPAVAAELGVLLPMEGTLFVASSMPVRDIETFWPVRPDPPRVLCNRGANGIDGTVSSAFGAAAHGEGPVVLLIGDVALAHDIGGLLAATRLDLKVTIVLVDNGGGGIFDFLPVAHTVGRSTEGTRDIAGTVTQDIYTRHIATPTGLDFAVAAKLYSLDYERARTTSELRTALEKALSPQVGSAIVHVQTDRAANVELHTRVWRAVSATITPPAGAVEPGT
jgi:2-succinyl-5-enolpyruvyl-6-hydroxy-3-cyclohexene-1-carboxylate synthase